ncbi:MAG: 3-hydroxyanthranilate 3,4-dioxygenase [Anaerolineae bacterium]|nr:3-hydroxyanthranilate 3,4-dioxygenase [Anaerolineae bacterium]
MTRFKPLNFKQWINDHRHLLKPPVGAKTVFEDSGNYMIFVVGGPNNRHDFHYNPTEEFFYQLEGDMILKIRENSQVVDVPIREDEIFLLPAKTLHSPQRKANTVGLVVEVKRPGLKDAVYWYCEQCGQELYSTQYQFDQIGTELTPIIEQFHRDEAMRTCRQCGTVLVVGR